MRRGPGRNNIAETKYLHVNQGWSMQTYMYVYQCVIEIWAAFNWSHIELKWSWPLVLDILGAFEVVSRFLSYTSFISL